MTQLEFDDKVLAAISGHLGVMEIAADLRIQGDPQARRLEEEQMLMQNAVTGLKSYDVTSELMSDSDVEYLFDLATSAMVKFP